MTASLDWNNEGKNLCGKIRQTGLTDSYTYKLYSGTKTALFPTERQISVRTAKKLEKIKFGIRCFLMQMEKNWAASVPCLQKRPGAIGQPQRPPPRCRLHFVWGDGPLRRHDAHANTETVLFCWHDLKSSYNVGNFHLNLALSFPSRVYPSPIH
ncbi:hypothetical protein H9L39_09088 [Fusarium oxysporum f. sp. albedinis]|nr:hypothetical protein H9L39_09088 [Fusarium oxysporum f. sp. albedinis]